MRTNHEDIKKFSDIKFKKTLGGTSAIVVFDSSVTMSIITGERAYGDMEFMSHITEFTTDEGVHGWASEDDVMDHIKRIRKLDKILISVIKLSGGK